MKALTHFGKKVRRLRTEHKLTQEELADRSDVSVVYLRGIEAGRSNPTLNVLFDLARGLGEPPTELIADIPTSAETRSDDRKRPGPLPGLIERKPARRKKK